MSWLFIQTAEARTIQKLAGVVTEQIINPLIIFIFAIATVIFIGGIVRYLANRSQQSEEIELARRNMQWGIIGMFIMASVFGIIQLLINSVGAGGIINL